MGTPKLTTEDWLERAGKVHGETYTYSQVVYTGADDKIIITCLTHGDFVQSASTHLSGKGCPKCGDARAGARRTEAAKKAFVQKANIKHSNKYTYDISTYVNSKTKMTVICKAHGEFYQEPSEHLKGHGCFKCSREKCADGLRKHPEQYVADCKSVHGDLYDYSLTKYRATHVKVDIICKIHGVFTTLAMSHLVGKGCPSCGKAGYKTTEPGSLYILTDDDLTKIGITNHTPKKRCTQICNDSGRRFTVLKSYEFQDGRIPNNVETLLLRELRKQHIQPQVPFPGSTECFYDVNLAALLNRIEALIKEQPQALLAA